MLELELLFKHGKTGKRGVVVLNENRRRYTGNVMHRNHGTLVRIPDSIYNSSKVYRVVYRTGHLNSWALVQADKWSSALTTQYKAILSENGIEAIKGDGVWLCTELELEVVKDRKALQPGLYLFWSERNVCHNPSELIVRV